MPQLASEFRVGEDDLSDFVLSGDEEDAVAVASQKFEVEKTMPMDDPEEEAQRQEMLDLFKRVEKADDESLSSGLAALDLIAMDLVSSEVRGKNKGTKRGADDMGVDSGLEGETVVRRARKVKKFKKH